MISQNMKSLQIMTGGKMRLYYFLKGYFQTITRERLTKNNSIQFEHKRQQRLEKQLQYVYEHTEYYKTIVAEADKCELNAYPIMNKKHLMNNLEALCTAPINKELIIQEAMYAEKTRNFTKRYKGYVYGLSSGTSGDQGVFILSNKEIALWSGAIFAKMNFFKIIGLKPTRIAFFMRANNDLYQSIGKFHIKFQFFDIFKSLTDNMQLLLEYNPTILVGQPSVLIDIVRKYEQNKQTLTIKYIYSIAERLEPHIEAELQRIFNVPIFQIYQATEGFIAFTHVDGNLYLNEDNFIIEKEYIDQERRRYNPIITDLERSTQPIIRYKMNDILIDSEVQDGIFTKLECIEGRNDEICIFNNVHIYPDELRTEILTNVLTLNDFRVMATPKSITVYIDGDESPLLINHLNEMLVKHGVEDIHIEIIYGIITRNKNKKLKRIEYSGGN